MDATTMDDTPLEPARTPAERIARRFGVKRLAAWTGRHVSRVHAWSWPAERGGTGGVVPHGVRARIIAGAANELGEAVTYAEFEPQGDEAYLTDDERPVDPAVLAHARAS